MRTSGSRAEQGAARRARGLNLVALAGHLSRPAQARRLPSGDRMVQLEVTVERQAERAETVPVVWFKSTATAEGWEAGQGVLVVGRVRRRFFRSGPELVSRTEVVADTVVPAERPRRWVAELGRVSDRAAEATEVD